MSPVGYGSSSSYSSMAPAYDGVSSFRATSEPRFLTNGSGLSIHNNASGTASSRSVSFGQGASSSSGNGVSTPFTNSRTSSFGNGVSLPFGHDAFSSFAHNNLPGLSNVSQFGYTSFSATPHASYQQSRLQGEHPGGTRDFGPIGPRNRQ